MTFKILEELQLFRQGLPSRVGRIFFPFPRASGSGCSDGREKTGGMPGKNLDVST